MRAKPSASMPKRITYLEKVLKTLNNNIKVVREALDLAEAGQEEMRKAWIKEQERNTFLLRELNDAQVRVHKLQTVVDTSKALSPANIKKAIEASMKSVLNAKTKRRAKKTTHG